MNIDNFPREGTDQCDRNFPEKTGQYNEINPCLFQFIRISIVAKKFFFINDHGRDAFIFRNLQYTGTGLITQDQGYFDTCCFPEMINDFLCIAAGTRCEYGDLGHNDI